MNRLYAACQWVIRLAALNLVWIGLSLAGGIVLGLFPATTAMFSVVRVWLDGEPDTPIWRHFAVRYRQDFFSANKFGWVGVLCGALFALDLFLAIGTDRLLLRIAAFTVLVLSLAYALVLPYAFPVFVHFAEGTRRRIVHTVVLGLGRPLGGLMAWAGLAGCAFAFVELPSLIPFFGGSVPAVWTVWVTRRYLTRAAPSIVHGHERHV